MSFTAKVFHSSTADQQHRASAAGHRFVCSDAERSLAELLETDPALLPYATALEQAGINAALAEDLDLAHLKELLPDAPVAHRLILRRRFSQRSAVKPVIPDTPNWKWTSRVLANGINEGNLKELSIISHEFDLLGGSLFLAFCKEFRVFAK